MIMLVNLWANSTYKPALFGTIIDVDENDTLNIRSKPNYKSKKVGSLPPEAYVAIEKCQNIKHSTWCSIYQIPQQFYEDFHSGWVNARYLKFSNRGYVNIQGKKRDCNYALACKDDKCSVVKEFDYDHEKDILSNLVVEQIRRDKLEPTSNFGAMSQEGDGYCTSARYIEDYLKKQNLNRLSQYYSGAPYDRVIALTQDLRGWINGDKLQKHIHPTKGVILTWNVRFGGKEDMNFGYSQIKNIEKERRTKIFWGQTYSKGDDVWISLDDYMKRLTRPIADITKLEKLKDLKGFKCHPSSECKGYEVFWIDEDSETKEYDYLGLVVILEEYQGKWYVVGMLRDRWII